ncbi:hypothetical protein NHM07_00220 [Bacillus subtilis]|uniref:hypothetical protein n=1 Tax=Bacillus subtilis TaxID=1423 RepID=UPI00209AE798|nr:hypothetical protein [Bacillus subtilis]MCO8147008.1 hypothetical protein [Bacillus subtilis]
MDKLQEIKVRISKLKGYENAKPTDQYWMAKKHIDFLINRTELSIKQQEIIEENKRQQEVTSTSIPAGTRRDSAAKWGIEASS